MKISELMHELTDYLIRYGDLQIKIGFVSENGNITFKTDDLAIKDDAIELYADIEDLKQFKQDIKALY